MSSTLSDIRASAGCAAFIEEYLPHELLMLRDERRASRRTPLALASEKDATRSRSTASLNHLAMPVSSGRRLHAWCFG